MLRSIPPRILGLIFEMRTAISGIDREVKRKMGRNHPFDLPVKRVKRVR
jgi:hypothetical protein